MKWLLALVLALPLLSIAARAEDMPAGDELTKVCAERASDPLGDLMNKEYQNKDSGCATINGAARVAKPMIVDEAAATGAKPGTATSKEGPTAVKP